MCTVRYGMIALSICSASQHRLDRTGVMYYAYGGLTSTHVSPIYDTWIPDMNLFPKVTGQDTLRKYHAIDT